MPGWVILRSYNWGMMQAGFPVQWDHSILLSGGEGDVNSFQRVRYHILTLFLAP
jgi:hypothetical protein